VPKPNPIPKVIALILVSVGMAFQMKQFDAASLAKMDSMPVADFMKHEHGLHMHSPLYWFFAVLVIGGFFVGAVDFIAYIIELFLKK
jgi:hypothetical protein